MREGTGGVEITSGGTGRHRKGFSSLQPARINGRCWLKRDSGLYRRVAHPGQTSSEVTAAVRASSIPARQPPTTSTQQRIARRLLDAQATEPPHRRAERAQTPNTGTPASKHIARTRAVFFFLGGARRAAGEHRCRLKSRICASVPRPARSKRLRGAARNQLSRHTEKSRTSMRCLRMFSAIDAYSSAARKQMAKMPDTKSREENQEIQ